MSLRSSSFALLALALQAALYGVGSGCAGEHDDDAGDGDADADSDADGDGDGDGDGPPVTDCETDLAPPEGGGTCEVVAGDDNLLLQGDVLTSDEVLHGGSVLVDEGGAIVCVGCDCSGEGEAAGATRVICADGSISPGLINAHDHARYDQNAPSPHGDERYENRQDWRDGRNDHTEARYESSGTDEQTLWGELRNVMGGATSIVGNDVGVPGLLRNLDDNDQALDEGLGQGRVRSNTFPLGDIRGETLDETCNYPDLDGESVLDSDAYVPHGGEGIDVAAHNEMLCLSNQQEGGVDLFASNAAFVHAIAISALDGALMAAAGTRVIWSPRTNIGLYGNTTPVTMLDTQGVTIALGTDWTVSGSMNMLRELKCADEYNTEHLDGWFGNWDLWEMATLNGARVTATDDVMGRLAVGMIADIAIFDGAESENFDAVLDAGVDDVALVLRSGEPLYGDADVLAVLPGGTDGCEGIDVCGREKSVCLERDTGVTLSELGAANTDSYDLFFCDDPDGEPSCAPFRADEYAGAVDGDQDGDGVVDENDDCPTIFNPIRPMDGGSQSDFDGDGAGDVCDVCPTSDDDVACPPVDPEDLDGDGLQDGLDNCRLISNVDQADADDDGKGDPCDSCPDDPNPGDGACPATIYQIKQGQFGEGQAVALTDVVVTGLRGNAFYVQVPVAGQDGDLGTAYSAIYCYVPDSNPDDVPIPQRGDRISFTAHITSYQHEIELNFITDLVTEATGEALPPVEIVDPSDVGEGGARAEELEAALVGVRAVDVSAVDETEFTVGGVLVVSDFIYAVTPLPAPGDTLDVTGILRVSNAGYRLNPRDAADVSLQLEGDPRLADFGPARSFVDQGAVDVVPSPDLRVTLDRPAPAGGTVVTLESAAPLSLTTLAVVTVPEGQTSAQVTVTALAASDTPVQVTASLGGESMDADVVVLDPARQPVLDDLQPGNATVYVGASTDFTVTLDIPARGDTPVGLTLAPGTSASLPGGASVVVLDGQLSATFAVTGTSAGSEELTASLNGSEVSANLTVNDSIDLGGWQLVQTSSDRTFTFPAGTIVSPGDYLIVARDVDRAAFEAFWLVSLGPNVHFFTEQGNWPNMNGGETYELLDDGGEPVDGPTIPLTELHAYARIAPDQDPGVTASWADTASDPGTCTPGAGQSASAHAGPYISEFADPGGPGNFVQEFVEIYVD